MRWHVAMGPGKRRKLDLSDRLDAIYGQIERLKAGVRAKVEHPFRMLTFGNSYGNGPCVGIPIKARGG